MRRIMLTTILAKLDIILNRANLARAAVPMLSKIGAKRRRTGKLVRIMRINAPM